MDKEAIAGTRCPLLFGIGSSETITTSALTLGTVQQRTSQQIIFVPEAEVLILFDYSKFKYCPKRSRAATAARPSSSADLAHLHFALPTRRRFVGLN